jgi:ABC-2 type transport system ATP-binding protein
MNESVAIRTENLGKTFGCGKKRVQAVKNLNLNVRSGQVYGFLGPNGAGKSTTIRLLMDLIRPTQGTVHIYGQDVRQRPQVLNRVGALVEGAAFYNYMNARDNLEVLARTANDYRPQRISALLEQVGLTDRAHQAVGAYSTGMKQRLGIAAALLGDPDLVILDEPTNGLDPAGIQEMRGFIRSLADEQNKTIFLSSHLLNEVEQVCDRVAIIYEGEIVRDGAVADLLTEGKAELRVQASPLDKAAEVLGEHWAVSRDGAQWLTVSAQPEDQPHIIKQLVAQGISVHQVVIQCQSLEEYFMAVTQAEIPANSGARSEQEADHV